MKTIKKIAAVLIIIVMMTAFVPTASAAVLPTFYYIWIGDTQITSLNKNDVYGDGTIKFDPETYTLTLTDAFIVAKNIRNAGITVGSSLDTSNPVKKLNIELVGDSYIYGSQNNPKGQICAGINCFYCNELNFTGEGTVTIKGYANETYTPAGIYGGQSTVVNVESGKVTIVGKNYKYYSFSDDCSVREKSDGFTVTHKTPVEMFFDNLFSAIGNFFISIGNFFKNLFR